MNVMRSYLVIWAVLCYNTHRSVLEGGDLCYLPENVRYWRNLRAGVEQDNRQICILT